MDTPHVLVVSSCANLHRGGQPLTTLNLVAELAEEGVRVSLVTALPADGQAVEELSALGIRVYTMSMHAHPLFAPFFAAYATARSLLTVRREGVDIIQVHAPSSALIGAILTILTSARLVVVVHGLWRKERAQSLPKTLQSVGYELLLAFERLVYRRVNQFALLVNHTDFADYLEEAGVSTEKRFLTYCGPPIRRFYTATSRERRELEAIRAKYHRMVLFIGRFDGQKGQDLAIRAFSSVSVEEESVGLILVGEGPNLDKCRNLASELGLSGRVVFLGNRADIHNILEVADVAITHLSPSLEGIGSAHREAVSQSVPLITKHDVVTEEVFGESIWYVNPHDPSSLAEVLSRILSNRNEAEQKAIEACDRLNRTLSWSRCTRDFRECYGMLK